MTHPRDVLQPLLDSIFQCRYYKKIVQFQNLYSLVRYPIDLWQIIEITKSEPEATVGLTIQYYKQYDIAERDTLRVPDYIEYAELWGKNGIIYVTNRGDSPRTVEVPSMAYDSIPDSAIANVVSSVFDVYFRVRWDFDPNHCYALVNFWDDTIDVSRYSLDYQTHETALNILYYKQQNKAERALFGIPPEQRLAELWVDGKKVETNR